MPARRKIDNSKPPLRKANEPVRRPPHSGIIRASVTHGIPTVGEPSALGHRRWRGNAYDTAHDRFII